MSKICSVSAKNGHFWPAVRYGIRRRTGGPAVSYSVPYQYGTIRQPVLTHSRTLLRTVHYGTQYGTVRNTVRPTKYSVVHGLYLGIIYFIAAQISASALSGLSLHKAVPAKSLAAN